MFSKVDKEKNKVPVNGELLRCADDGFALFALVRLCAERLRLAEGVQAVLDLQVSHAALRQRQREVDERVEAMRLVAALFAGDRRLEQTAEDVVNERVLPSLRVAPRLLRLIVLGAWAF